MSQFIVVTRMAAGVRHPGLRIAVAQIVGYYPVAGGAAIVTADGGDDWWAVAETVDDIDALIAGPGRFAHPADAGAWS